MKSTSVVETSPVATNMMESQLSQLAKLDVGELKQELAKAMVVTATAIIRMAAIVHLLEKRGEDLSDIRLGMLHMLRRVACGQVLPELMVKFQGMPNLLKRVAKLPLADQKMIVDDKPLKVAIIEDGKRSHRLVNLLKMTPQEIRRVLADDHIREVGEQVSLMESAQETSGRVNRPPVTIDSRRGGILVTGDKVFISFQELASHVAALSGR